MPQLSEPLPSVVLTYNDVLPNTSGHVYFELPSWDRPINYFVGRNGTAKPRTAKAIASRVSGSRYLSTDRLTGFMSCNWFRRFRVLRG